MDNKKIKKITNSLSLDDLVCIYTHPDNEKKNQVIIMRYHGQTDKNNNKEVYLIGPGILADIVNLWGNKHINRIETIKWYIIPLEDENHIEDLTVGLDLIVEKLNRKNLTYLADLAKHLYNNLPKVNKEN
ncbi:MAG: hypothetical protein QXP53_02355 [Candidatus Pacearchaeota archaeon]